MIIIELKNKRYRATLDDRDANGVVMAVYDRGRGQTSGVGEKISGGTFAMPLHVVSDIAAAFLRDL